MRHASRPRGNDRSGRRSESTWSAPAQINWRQRAISTTVTALASPTMIPVTAICLTLSGGETRDLVVPATKSGIHQSSSTLAGARSESVSSMSYSQDAGIRVQPPAKARYKWKLACVNDVANEDSRAKRHCGNTQITSDRACVPRLCGSQLSTRTTHAGPGRAMRAERILKASLGCACPKS